MICHFTVYGHLFSMKNGRIYTGKGRLVKHHKARAFERAFALQVGQAVPLEPLAGPVVVAYDVWYPHNRQDLDTALLDDCLQACGFIGNDRQIVERHARKNINAPNPRVEVWLWELGNPPGRVPPWGERE